jgi:hypothetical protein
MTKYISFYKALLILIVSGLGSVNDARANPDTDEYIAALELLVERNIIGEVELSKIVDRSLYGEVVNPISQHKVQNSKYLATFHELLQELIDRNEVDPIDVDYWASKNLTFLRLRKAILTTWNKPITMEEDRGNSVQKIFPLGLPDSKASIPFEIIKYLSGTNWDAFIVTAMEALGIEAYEKTDKLIMRTSCIITAVILPVIFLGIDKAKQIRALDRKNYKIRESIELSNGEKFTYLISGLFNGVVPSRFEEGVAFLALDDDSRSDVLENAVGGLNDYHDDTKLALNSMNLKTDPPEIAIAKIEDYLRNLNYSFNINTINNLIDEIDRNCGTTDGNSILYFIAIKTPIDPKGDKHQYEHAFILEQFFKDGVPYFRLYQSWAGIATIYDTIKQESHLEKAWTRVELSVFFERLIHAYCFEHTKESVEKCFGFGDEENMPILQFIERHLTGINLSYIACEFDPTTAIDNLIDLNKLWPNAAVVAEQEALESRPLRELVRMYDDARAPNALPDDSRAQLEARLVRAIIAQLPGLTIEEVNARVKAILFGEPEGRNRAELAVVEAPVTAAFTLRDSQKAMINAAVAQVLFCFGKMSH